MTCWSVTLTWCGHSLLKCPSVLHCESVFFAVRVSLTGWSSSNDVTTTQFTHLHNTLPLIDLTSFYKVTVFLLAGYKWLYGGNTINIRVHIFECRVAWRAGGGWWLMVLWGCFFFFFVLFFYIIQASQISCARLFTSIKTINAAIVVALPYKTN